MSSEETSSLRQLAENKAAFATEVFSSISNDVVLLTEFAHSALARSDDGSAMPLSPGIPAQGWTADASYTSGSTWDRSVYYLPGRTGADYSPDNLPTHTRALLNKTTALDMAFRTLQERYGTSGTLLYIGLEDTDNPNLAVDPAEHSIYITYP